jgi:hypothetical protein
LRRRKPLLTGPWVGTRAEARCACAIGAAGRRTNGGERWPRGNHLSGTGSRSLGTARKIVVRARSVPAPALYRFSVRWKEGALRYSGLGLGDSGADGDPPAEQPARTPGRPDAGGDSPSGLPPNRP